MIVLYVQKFLLIPVFPCKNPVQLNQSIIVLILNQEIGSEHLAHRGIARNSKVSGRLSQR